MWINKLFDRLAARSRTIVLTPNVSVIGNCAENLFFGFVKARREGKRLLVVHPFELPWKFRFPVTNREMFDVASPLRRDLPAPLHFLARLALTLVYGPVRAFDLILGKLTGVHLHGKYTHPGIGTTTLWQPREDMETFRWDVVDSYHWAEEVAKPLEVYLRPKKRARAHALRLEMGIPEDAWFVGLHVREGGFYNDHAASECRNADILNYQDAIRAVTDRGGWVVRMGDATMKRLPPMERVVDYPFTRFKSDLMDIYLLAECRFYVGMLSGIVDVALLFQKPMVLTNMTNWTFCWPRRPGDRGILKHVRSKKLGRFLSLQEIFEQPWEAQQFRLLNDDYAMEENTPEELREIVVEFMDQRDPSERSELQKLCDARRLVHGRRLVDEVIYADHFDDMHNRYRTAARILSARGSLGRKFVEQNWAASAREGAAARR